MTALRDICLPVLSCAEALALEKRILGDDEALEWRAMQQAGRAIARSVLADFEEIGGFRSDGCLLALVGKGHNGGDALIASEEILRRFPLATAQVIFVFGERSLRTLASRAWRELVHSARDRVSVVGYSAATALDGHSFELCLDGIFGFQFRPPSDQRIVDLIAQVNALPIRLRAAVDLPSADLFRADFTYATGSVKTPVMKSDVAGRIRYLDLGFFAGMDARGADSNDRVLTGTLLDPLRALRSARSDKRSYGHVFLLGGSRGYPGAILMAAMAALRSGAGLVTAFAPESLVAGFAANLPEAIWVGWPETPDGGLALEGESLLRERIDRADALVIGPGLGREPETLALVLNVVKTSAIPLVLDADALQPDIVLAGNCRRVITPHAGEFKRVAGDVDLRTFARNPNLTVILKGPVTQLCAGAEVYHSFAGGPVLARGGSGDLLAGMAGAQLAQLPQDPLLAAARAVVWHGQAADLLARAHGQVAVRTTQVLDYLGAVLRSSL